MSGGMGANAKPVCILVTALGGEGGGVLAEWLVETALRAGHSVQSTSIPGVAQRTGATTYYVEVFPQPDAELGGRKPVFSLNPVPGAIDLLVSSELLETVRQIGAGMATSERTHILASTSRSLTTVEKMQPADGRTSSADLLAVVREFSREAQVFDMAQTARGAGTVISAVLFGAIAACGALPLPRAAYEATIRASDKGAAASLRGFAAAFDRVAALRAERSAIDSAVAAVMQEGVAARRPHRPRPRPPSRRPCARSSPSATPASSTTRTQPTPLSTSSGSVASRRPSSRVTLMRAAVMRRRSPSPAGWRSGWPSTTSSVSPT